MKRPANQIGIKIGLTRRDFLWLTSLSAAGMLTGCATNPVTGDSQFMLVSEQSEIDLDRKNSPQQFSADYGATQDDELNRYLQQVGKKTGAATHRPHMPYSFRCVNATYINAYAFPGGSIAATRGILLTLDDEAELAALLGHELGHVNARHTARQMSKGMLTQMVVGGVALYAGSHSAAMGDLASTLGSLGAGALLAYYSRDNEREADALGLAYMVKTGYSSNGFVGLMDMLNNLSKHKPSSAELLFATHPMGSERYQTAVQAVKTQYQGAEKNPLYRERYMDKTAGLRSIEGAIVEMQKGDKAMGQKKYDSAETHYQKALQQAPRDYTALVVMAKCQLMQKKYDQAGHYIEKAQQVYPQEAQAQYLGGLINMNRKKYALAYEDIQKYDRLMPGNPNSLFFKGYALEGMQKKESAAENYYRYLQKVNQGEQAQYAYHRLVEWGYLKK